MTDTFNDNDAATRKSVQYFEIVGQRGIWQEGWKAVTFHQRGDDYDADARERYHLDKDIAGIDNLAADHPEKLESLK